MEEKVNVRIVTLGRTFYRQGFLELKKWKSALFNIVSVEHQDLLFFNPDIDSRGYSDNTLRFNLQLLESVNYCQLVKVDLIFYLIDAPLQDNRLSRIFDINKVVITFSEIKDILLRDYVPFKNYIISNLYCYSLLFMNNKGSSQITIEDRLHMIHGARRGCVFDMGDVKTYSSVSYIKPRLCDKCKHKLRVDIPLNKIDEELKKLDRKKYYKMIIWLKHHPLLSTILSFITGIASGILSSFLYQLLKDGKLYLLTTLFICTIGTTNVNAQAKEYQVENDGFEWYKISDKGLTGAQNKYGNAIIPTTFYDIDYLGYGVFKVMNVENGVKYGAIDSKGNLIVPIEYNNMWIFDRDIPIRPVITVEKNNYQGIYDLYGNCLIPINRGYKVSAQVKSEWNNESGIFFICGGDPTKERIITLCDASGKIIFKSKNQYSTVYIAYDKGYKRCALIAYSSNGCFFIDQEDNVLWNPHCYTIQPIADGIKVKKTKESVFRKLTPAELNKIWLKESLTKGNAAYFASLENKLQQQNASSSSTASSSTSKDNNNSNSNNSGSGTTTIVVEQHGPVQVWVACGGCQLSPGRCSYCNGSGWGYNNRLCSRCNGTGKCTICNGTGGHSEVQYR